MIVIRILMLSAILFALSCVASAQTFPDFCSMLESQAMAARNARIGEYLANKCCPNLGSQQPCNVDVQSACYYSYYPLAESFGQDEYLSVKKAADPMNCCGNSCQGYGGGAGGILESYHPPVSGDELQKERQMVFYRLKMMLIKKRMEDLQKEIDKLHAPTDQ